MTTQFLLFFSIIYQLHNTFTGEQKYRTRLIDYKAPVELYSLTQV